MYFNDTLGHVLLQIFPNQAISSTSYALRFLNDRREYSWFATTWQGGNIGRRNNRIFSQRIYIKIEFSSQRREKLLFLTINMAAVTSRTGCLAVLFWSGRVRMSGGPPPPTPFRRNTKSKSNGYPVTKFCVRLGNTNSQTDFSNNDPFVYRPYFFVFFDVQQRGEVVTSRCHGSKISGWQQTENSLRTVQNFINFIQFDSICQMFAKFLGEIPKDGI